MRTLVRATVALALCTLAAAPAAMLEPSVSAARTVCRVPDVRGTAQRLAEAKILEDGCIVGELTQPRGLHANQLIILAQSRQPGELAPPGAPINLRLGLRVLEPHGCAAPRASKVVARTSSLLAWTSQREAPRRFARSEPPDPRLFACAGPHGAAELLFEAEFYKPLPSVRAAGRFIAYALNWGFHAETFSTIALFDVARDAAVYEQSYATNSLATPETYTTIGSYALSATADLAWVGETVEESPAPGTRDTLYLRDASGSHVIEAAERIGAVAFARGSLHWSSDGLSHSLAVSG